MKNFIGFFEKRQIRIKTLYLLEDRIVFLHVSYGTACSDVWIYVTSEHDISADGTTFPKIQLIQQDEEYPLPTAAGMIRNYLQEQIELVQNGKIKLLHASKKFIVYITRHNEVDFFELGDSALDKGFYFVTEWKYFFDHSREIPSSLRRLEETFIDASYEVLHSHENEIVKTHKQITETVQSVGKSSELSRQLIERSRKCDRLLEQHQASGAKQEVSQKILELSSKMRQENLQKAFETYMISDALTKLNKIF